MDDYYRTLAFLPLEHIYTCTVVLYTNMHRPCVILRSLGPKQQTLQVNGRALFPLHGLCRAARNRKQAKKLKMKIETSNLSFYNGTPWQPGQMFCFVENVKSLRTKVRWRVNQIAPFSSGSLKTTASGQTPDKRTPIRIY